VSEKVIKQEERAFYELLENYGYEQGRASDLATDYFLEKSPEFDGGE
jgi:hypothetical protein